MPFINFSSKTGIKLTKNKKIIYMCFDIKNVVFKYCLLFQKRL